MRMLTRRDIDDCAIRATEGKYAIDDDRHRLWFRASSNNLCPDGMLIEGEAWREGMPKYMRNPVVCDSHRYDSVTDRVIGKTVAWEIDGKGLLLQVEFGTGTQRGADAWYLYRQGYASAGSVGFDPQEREPLRSKDDEVEGERVTKSQLLEFSGCVIPCDDEALAQKDATFAEIRKRIKQDYGGETDVVQTDLPCFRDIKGVDIETREGEPDRIGEILERLERIEAAVEDVDDLIAARITGVTITALAVEAERIDIDEPAWRKYIREVSADDDRSFDEVMADLRKHKP